MTSGLQASDAINFRHFPPGKRDGFLKVVRVSASNEWPFIERRRSNRPMTGDRRPCPSCRDVMRFYERYVVSRGTASSMHPAWVCRCGYEQYVRSDHQLRHA